MAVAKVIFNKRRDSAILEKGIVSICYLVAWLLLLAGYYKFIVPNYGYSGFQWNPDNAKMLQGILLVILIPLILPVQFEKPSDLLVHLQFLFPIVPMLVLYGATGGPTAFLYVTVGSYLIIVILSAKLRFRIGRLANINPFTLLHMLLILSYVIIAIIFIFGGAKYMNFDFRRVYEFRSIAASNLPGIYGYISPFTSKIFLPFSLMLAIILRKTTFALLSIAGSIMMFGLTAHKGPFFYPFAVLSLYYISRKKHIIRMLLSGYIFVEIISIINFFFFEDHMVGSLMLRRSFLVPAHLNYLYYYFFSHHSHTFWAESKITLGFINYHYNLDVPHLIGSVFYKNQLTGANTGWIGSGYANAGFIGMILYGFIIGLLFSILNSYSDYIDKSIIVAIITAPMLAVMESSDLPTAFLNHGVILSLILLSLFTLKKEDYAIHKKDGRFNQQMVNKPLHNRQ